MILIIVITVIGAMLIVVGIAFIRTHKKKKCTEQEAFGGLTNYVSLDESKTSVIHFSDDFKSSKPITIADHNHTVTTILMRKEDNMVWTCPSCETENSLSREKCWVCHYIKRGETHVL